MTEKRQPKINSQILPAALLNDVRLALGCYTLRSTPEELANGVSLEQGPKGGKKTVRMIATIFLNDASVTLA